MEIKIPTTQILKVLQVISWIIFIGLCIEAGSIAVNFFITLFINPQGVENFWSGSDYLSGLYKFDQGHSMVIALLMLIVAVLKAVMFYLIIRLFSNKNLSISKPFSLEIRHFTMVQAYLALGIGLFSHSGSKYAEWLTTQGMETANMRSLHLDGADVWLFMAVILFIIGQVIKRGVEMQNENDLTI